jgi:hypothetical protein
MSSSIRLIRRAFSDSATPASKRPFPRMHFDLKAFRKGISEKKHSLIEAEKKEISRAYAKPAPEGWDMLKFLSETRIADLGNDGPIKNEDDRNKFYQDLAGLFADWADLVSSSRKDLFRVSHMLNSRQLKKLAHCIDLFNHDLFPNEVATESTSVFSTPIPVSPWTPEDDATLIKLATGKYDHTFGDVWIYIASEMARSVDDVEQRFYEIYMKPENKKRIAEIALTKSFRPLLMNRQFRLIPPQCYIVPSAENFPADKTEFKVPKAFEKYM